MHILHDQPAWDIKNDMTSTTANTLRKLFQKHRQISISLYILVPAIFTGISLLSFIIAVNVYRYLTTARDFGLFWLVVWSAAVSIATFLCGFLIVYLIVRPMKLFVERASRLPELSMSGNIERTKDELERFHYVVKEVTRILGTVESREYFPDIIGRSRRIRSLFSEILQVAPTESTVLITGESGTGKELVADSIHNHSLRKGKPYIKLNCVAIPEGLLESELFGHEKGAFTGATARKRGKFELAHGGTLMLDEIGDMPLETQAKLLRVLQDRRFERVGGADTITSDVRFIAASNKDLEKMVGEGTFREDLYYRLNVIHLHIPPLRERKEDIPLLVELFLHRSGRDVSMSPLALQYLVTYDWPGNVRELENTIERMSVMTDTGVIEPGHIPRNILSEVSQQGGLKPSFVETEDLEPGESIDQHLSRVERTMIVDALRATGGIQAKAARLLGIKERSLWHRIKKYEIDISSLKATVEKNGTSSNHVE